MAKCELIYEILIIFPDCCSSLLPPDPLLFFSIFRMSFLPTTLVGNVNLGELSLKMRQTKVSRNS